MTDPVTVAVDANGADLGPAEVARGAALAAAAGTRVLLFGPAAELGDAAGGRRGRRRPGLDREGRRPGARRPRARPSPRSCAPSRPSPTGRADALVSGGSTGAALAAGAVPLQARARRAPPGAGDRRARPERAVPAARRRRERRGAARAPRPVRAHGRGVHGGRDGRASARAWRCSPTARSRRKGPEIVVAAHAALARAARRPQLHRQRRGLRDRHRRGRRDRGRRLRRQRDAEGDGGHVGRAAGRDPRRRRRRRRGRSSAGCCCGRRCAALRDELDPQEQGGAVLLGLRRLGVVPHGSFGARGFARAIEVAARGVRLDVVGRTHERLGGRRGASEGVRAGRYGARPVMTRDEVLELIREHLADELELDPGADHGGDALPQRPARRTRSTSTRSCRSSRTPTGSRCPTRRRRGSGPCAPRSTSCSPTFRPHLRAAPSNASRDPDLCARCTTCWNGCRTSSPGRRSRMPRGSRRAATPTSGSRSWATRCSAWRSRRTCIPRLESYGAGRLTKIRAQAVSGRSCRAVAERLGMPERLRAAAPRRRRRRGHRGAARRPSGCWPR